MERNEGTIDRAVRILLGLALLLFFFLEPGNSRYLGLVGLVPLFTGAAGYCPLYAVIGVRTRRRG